jgi:hypothetical protein
MNNHTRLTIAGILGESAKPGQRLGFVTALECATETSRYRAPSLECRLILFTREDNLVSAESPRGQTKMAGDALVTLTSMTQAQDGDSLIATNW